MLAGTQARPPGSEATDPTEDPLTGVLIQGANGETSATESQAGRDSGTRTGIETGTGTAIGRATETGIGIEEGTKAGTGIGICMATGTSQTDTTGTTIATRIGPTETMTVTGALTASSACLSGSADAILRFGAECSVSVLGWCILFTCSESRSSHIYVC